jgi:chaperone BCS1
LALNHRILNEILLEAKKTYQAAQENMISVYVADMNNSWRHIASRAKRSMNSIVLDPGIKDLLIDDANDFLQSKPWYAARGIPFRRGYLLVRYVMTFTAIENADQCYFFLP